MRLELPPPQKKGGDVVSNKLTITLQPRKLYLKTWCYFNILKLKLLAICCAKIMNLGLRMLEVGLLDSGTSRVVEVAEAEVAEAACTKSMESTASH